MRPRPRGTGSPGHHRARPFYGWVVVWCAFSVLALTYGVQYSFGVFVPAIVEDLAWPRASLGGAFSVYSLVYTALSFASGRLTDTLGPRRVIGIGAVALGLGVMAVSRMSSVWELYLWYGLIAALGMSTAYIPCNMTVVRWFERRRGLALGIASSGASAGILLVPLLGAALIDTVGWRGGLLVLGAALLVVIGVASRFLVRAPEDLGLAPDGGPRPDGGTAPAPGTASADADLSLPEARRTLCLWWFVVAFAVTLVSLLVPFVHLPGIAGDLGLAPMSGAATVSVIGLFSLAGSLGAGSLSDRIGRKGAMLLAMTAQVAAFVLFLAARDHLVLYAGAAAFGFFYGGFVTLFPALVGDLFGRRHAGAIGGLVFGGGGLLGTWGPAAVGYLRDVQGDYVGALLACTGVAVLALALFAALPRPRRSREAREGAVPD